jgi:hypothetical protein
MDMAKKAGIVVFAYGKPRHRQLRSRGAVLARILIEKAGVTPHILRLGSWLERCPRVSSFSIFSNLNHLLQSAETALSPSRLQFPSLYLGSEY